MSRNTLASLFHIILYRPSSFGQDNWILAKRTWPRTWPISWHLDRTSLVNNEVLDDEYKISAGHLAVAGYKPVNLFMGLL